MIDSRRIKKFWMRHLRHVVSFAEVLSGRKFPIFLDYHINPVPRYGYGKPPHKKLYELINDNSEIYKKNLVEFRSRCDAFLRINGCEKSDSSLEPHLSNDFVPVLDALVLYSFLTSSNPGHYFEIGSGESTKFARRAIRDSGLRTRITSIDPFPRSRINTICDVVVRRPVEEIDLNLFEKLEADDILFVDGSHRVFQNSDVTVCFLDILPLLKPGVLVHFHDIVLPWDYSQEYGGQRYYSEQYLLAAFILAEGNRFEIVMPNFFVSHKPQFRGILEQLNIGRPSGSSFWIRMN